MWWCVMPRGRWHDITAPNMYAPTEDKSDDWWIRAGIQSVSKVMQECVIGVNAYKWPQIDMTGGMDYTHLS